MALAYNAARVTRVADDLGLPRWWLNEQASVYISGKEDASKRRVFDHPGLRVMAASPAHVFAMKARAARTRDIDDLPCWPTSLAYFSPRGSAHMRGFLPLMKPCPRDLSLCFSSYSIDLLRTREVSRIWSCMQLRVLSALPECGLRDGVSDGFFNGKYVCVITEVGDLAVPGLEDQDIR